VTVVVPGDLDVGGQRILLREAGGNAIAARFGELLSEIERKVHGAVLKDLQNVGLKMQDKEARPRLESELDRQLGMIHLESELETYLVGQELRQLLVDRVQGFGRTGDAKAAATLGASIVDRLHAILGLDRDADAPDRIERIDALLPWALQTHRNLVPAATRRSLALALLHGHLSDLMFGYGPLEGLMSARDINDIMVLPSGHIYIERRGTMQDSGRRMLSPEVSRKIIERIVSSEKRHIDHSKPMVDARVADGSRLNAIIEPVALRGPALTIRRFADRRLSMNELVEIGTLTESVAEFLKACVHARRNIVISGGTGSGKTTLLNALASYVPAHERIVTVEDTAEIRLSQVHVVTLQAKMANREGEKAIPIRELVRNTLRMRPDRIIVGECRGAEALDMLQAMNTGHDGSLTTVHANSAWDAVGRLEVMAMEAPDVKLPSRALREQIVAAVDVIVQISRMGDKVRRVTSICEVMSVDDGTGNIVMEEVFTYRRRKSARDVTHDALSFTGYVPTFMEALLDAGARITCLR
jgi:pilus assembly protein CpaF